MVFLVAQEGKPVQKMRRKVRGGGVGNEVTRWLMSPPWGVWSGLKGGAKVVYSYLIRKWYNN